MYSKLIAVFLSAIAVNPALAIDVSGDSYGTWTVDDSPYVVVGDLTVPSGETLVIEPGVEVRFDGHYKFSVSGDLVSVGTTAQWITFTRDSATDASRGWGLRIDAGTTEIAHTVVEHGYAGGAVASSPDNRGGGLYVSGGTVTVRDSEFRYNEAAAGGGLYIGGGTVQVERTAIHHNESVYNAFNACGGGGLYVANADSSVVIRNNLIHQNSYDNGNTANFEGGGGVYLNDTSARFVGNTVWGNTAGKGAGILVKPTGTVNPVIANNIVWANSGSGEQIAVEVSYISGGTISPDLEVVNNVIDADGIHKVYRNTFEEELFGVGTIEDDPLLVDPSAGDFSLSSGSPAIDAADASVDGHACTDFHDLPRCDALDPDTGSGPPVWADVGALEYTDVYADCDGDCDAWADLDDNCPTVANEDQADDDLDDVGNECDLCWGDNDTGDSDADGVCDSDDDCLGMDHTGDTDDDGTCDDLDPDDDGDGCADVVDADPLDDGDDTDEDGVDDDCDPCPLDIYDDSDADLVCDSDDLCWGNDAFGDEDEDGICDEGEVQADADGDGVYDDWDRCEGDDFAGDSDGDGTCDDLDPCYGEDDSGDEDGDGACLLDVDGKTPWDCDDEDDQVYPGAPELCDGKDNTCAGAVPDEDADTDGDGLSICAGDCDDDDVDVYLGADEICDGKDDDCDGTPPLDEVDADADGYRTCEECDDLNADVYPGADEVCDGVDDDCDGTAGADEVDADGDGVLLCAGDCDDDEPLASPMWPEFCWDAIDNDCDGDVDEDCQALPEEEGGCGCRTTDRLAGVLGPWLVLAGVLAARRRRARAGSPDFPRSVVSSAT